jgi:hypothetical protein
MTCASVLCLLVNSAATSSNGTLPTGPTDDDHNNPTLMYQINSRQSVDDKITYRSLPVSILRANKIHYNSVLHLHRHPIYSIYIMLNLR